MNDDYNKQPPSPEEAREALRKVLESLGPASRDNCRCIVRPLNTYEAEQQATLDAAKRILEQT